MKGPAERLVIPVAALESQIEHGDLANPELQGRPFQSQPLDVRLRCLTSGLPEEPMKVKLRKLDLISQ